MIIYRHFSEIPAPLPNAVVTIGNFDGVHLGHREIFRRVKEEARKLGGVSVVITFIPHPLKVIPSGKQLRLINTYEEKEVLIEASGIDYLVSIPFDDRFAALTARQFVEQVLVGAIGVKRLIIGYDYAFGRNREGNVTLLQQLGAECGFTVEVLQPIGKGDLVYSSTTVRSLISEGAVDQVIRLLGRHFSLAGKVVHGEHRGKSLGFPTANVTTDKELIPAHGVYAVKVKIDEATYDGACNVGSNPTFGGTQTSIEVFIFDFTGELYGQELRIYFVQWLRGEQKFPDVTALQEAIAADVARCRAILRDTTIIEYREYLEGV